MRTPRNRQRRRVQVVPLLLTAALLASVAACGSSSSTGSSTSTTSGEGSNADVAAAKAAIAPYTGQPSAFPATEKLDKLPPDGSEYVYLQCISPFCAQLAKGLVAPTKALGVKLSTINSGLTATSSQSAASSALAKDPAAVLISAVQPQAFGQTLHQLGDAGVAVAGVGIVDGKPYGVQASIGTQVNDKLAGKLMADWIRVNKGPDAKVVFFGSPELDFSPLMQKGFEDELTNVCPGCTFDSDEISVLTIGTTAPAKVVSYLQSHPDTNTAVFAAMDTATGLAAALKVADMHITTLGFAPSASNLQDIKDGGLTAGLAVDSLVQAWVFADVAARLVTKQPIKPSELNVDLQFLEQDDVTTADTVNGWTGYPDTAERFAKLWPSR
jgi:ribose transport system substrate-binding protein